MHSPPASNRNQRYSIPYSGLWYFCTMSYCTEGRARWPIPLYNVYSVYCETSIPFHTVLSVSGRPSILSREVKYRLRCGLYLPPLVEIGGRDLGPADSVSRASSWRRRWCREIFCPTRKEIHRTRRSARARSAAATSGGPPPILYLARALGDGVGAVGFFWSHREKHGVNKTGLRSDIYS